MTTVALHPSHFRALFELANGNDVARPMRRYLERAGLVRFGVLHPSAIEALVKNAPHSTWTPPRVLDVDPAKPGAERSSMTPASRSATLAAFSLAAAVSRR